MHLYSIFDIFYQQLSPCDMECPPYIDSNTLLPLLHISLNKCMKRGHICCIVDHTLHTLNIGHGKCPSFNHQYMYLRITGFQFLFQLLHRLLVCNITRSCKSCSSSCDYFMSHLLQLVCRSCHQYHFPVLLG